MDAVSKVDAVAVVPEHFPAGLRVLVVDDDVVWLKIIEKMLSQCNYYVTICSRATAALDLLRERRGCFDVVLSDVHMPDMDGFKLLELVGLEMDLPVIMMSADGRTNLVMRGIQHGACDYLIKPIRHEELKNIWQHVVRKKCSLNKENDNSSSFEDNDRPKQGCDDAENDSSIIEGADRVFKTTKKKRESKEEEDDADTENDDTVAGKKPRVVWSVELHQQFVSAVNQLGIDKAVPKRILELMNIPGLTRENVASHLQKFRLYLKRLSGFAQQGGLPNSFCGPIEQIPKLGALGCYDIQALAASCQISPQTLAALNAELLGRPTSGLGLQTIDHPALLHTSLQGTKYTLDDQDLGYGQHLIKCPPKISKQITQQLPTDHNVPSAVKAWSTKNICVVPSVNLSAQNCNNNMSTTVIPHHQQQKLSTSPESHHLISVQPSCLMVPAANFQGASNMSSVNQNNFFSKNNVVLDSRILSEPGSLSLSVTSCSANADNSISWQAQNSACMIGGADRHLAGIVRNLGIPVADNQGPISDVCASRGSSIPSRFAVDESEWPISNIHHSGMYNESNTFIVKQESDMKFVDTAKVGVQVPQKISREDFMSVLR